MKVSFLLSIAFGIVTVVSVFMVWSVLGAAGVWSSINSTVSDMVSSGNNDSTFNVQDYLGTSRVLGFTMLVSVIDVVLITAIATLGAFLYNMASSLLGGIEVTLAEDPPDRSPASLGALRRCGNLPRRPPRRPSWSVVRPAPGL